MRLTGAAQLEAVSQRHPQGSHTIMPLHHYLPATFLAGFSLDTTTLPRRARLLSVGDKQQRRVFRTTAANIAAVNNLYTLVNSSSDPQMMEVLWSSYEAKLDEAIALLVAGGVDASTWARILVPFVACMLVRGPDFDRRLERRIRALGIDPRDSRMSQDNTNGARLLELQRLLGPVCVAKWVVIHLTGKGKLITNDLGYAPFANPPSNQGGLAIPLDNAHVLAIIPRSQGSIAVALSGKWAPLIDYVDLPFDDHHALNEPLSSLAQRFIFASDDKTARRWLGTSSHAPFPPEPGDLGFISDPLARAHEFTWHRLVPALEADPATTTPWDFQLDWAKLADGWKPMVFLPMNLLEFPPALRREGDTIIAEFYDPTAYYALSSIREHELNGSFDQLAEEATQGLALTNDDALKARFLVARGSAFDELDRYDDAIRDYDHALELVPKSLAAMTNRAVSLLKMGRVDAAALELENVLSIDSTFAVARSNLGHICSLRGDPASAVREITAAIESLPAGPAQGAAHLSRGNAFLTLGDNQEAIEDFASAFDCYPDPAPRAFCKYLTAIGLSKEGNISEAFQAIRASLDLDPQSHDARLFHSRLTIEHGEPQDAIAPLTDLVESSAPDPIRSRAHDLRARAHSHYARHDIALANATRAVELDPTTSESHHNRGMTLLFRGETVPAIEEFDNALKLDNRNAGALNNRGIARAARGELQMAIMDFRASAELYAESNDAGSPNRHLALCHAISLDHKAASAALNEARRVDHGSPFNVQIEGFLSLYSGDFEAARRSFAKAAAQQPDIADVRVYMSLPLAFLGDLDEARALGESAITEFRFPLTKEQFILHLERLQAIFPESEFFSAFVASLPGNIRRGAINASEDPSPK